MKSINSQTSNTSPGNDGLKGVFYKHFSNELAPVLLDVFDSWGKCYFSNRNQIYHIEKR